MWVVRMFAAHICPIKLEASQAVTMMAPEIKACCQMANHPTAGFKYDATLPQTSHSVPFDIALKVLPLVLLLPFVAKR
jgi:hypothetical protein